MSKHRVGWLHEKHPFSVTLRKALDNAPEPRSRISKETGISETSLCRFLHGERGMSVQALDVLCEYLGLRLVQEKKKDK